jgi:hypothetical protein
MAEKTVISIEVEGTGKAINSIKELKAELKAAQSAALNGDGKAAKRVAELKDKMDDLTDSTKSLQGSGVERIGSGFNLLGQGFKDMDLDKIKTGFKGLGSAMNAIPLMIIVSGVMMLMEKFDIMGKVVDLVTNLFYAFTDAIGLTNKADEKFAKEAVANAQNVQKAKEAQYDAEIKMAQAAGQDVKELELEKLKSIENSIQSQLTALEDLKTKKKKLNDEEQKQYDELQLNLIKSSADRIAKELSNAKEQQQQLANLANLEDKLRVAGLSEREKQIDAVKKQEQQLRDELEKNHKVRLGNEKNDTIRYNEDVKKIQELTQREINQINNKYYEEAKVKKKAADDKAKAESDAQRLLDLQKAKEDEAAIELQSQQLINADKVVNETLTQDQINAVKAAKSAEEYEAWLKTEEAKKAIRLQNINEDINLTRGALQATQNLTDIFFAVKMAKVKKGSKEEEDLARKQFNINKALQLGLATIDGFKAISASLASSPVAIGPVPNPAGIASLAFVAISTAATIAKIASSQFKGGGGAGGGGGEMPSVGSPSIPTSNGTPSIAAPTQNTTTFTGNANNNFNQPPIKTYVVETDLRNSTNTIDKIKDQATF